MAEGSNATTNINQKEAKEDSKNKSKWCLSSCLLPSKEPLELTSCISVIMLIIGIILVSLGYLIPRNFKAQDDLSARDNEKLVKYYEQLGNKLNIVIVCGLTILSVGSVSLSTLLTITLYKHEVYLRRDKTNQKQQQPATKTAEETDS